MCILKAIHKPSKNDVFKKFVKAGSERDRPQFVSSAGVPGVKKDCRVVAEDS